MILLTYAMKRAELYTNLRRFYKELYDIDL